MPELAIAGSPGARRLAPRVRAASATLFALAALAIYAPLIANDRPLWLEARDLRGHRAAASTLALPAQSFADLVARGRASFEASREGASFDAALAGELDALERRIGALERQLDPKDAAPLRELRVACAQARASVDQRAALDARLETHAAALLATAERAAGRFDPEAPDAPEPRARASSPALAALTPLEAALIVLWPCVGFAVLARNRRAWSRRAAIVGLVLASTAAALALAFGRAEPHAASSFKLDATRGDTIVERAVFAPVPMGFAETHLTEAYRPPTWTAAARSRGAGDGAAQPGALGGARFGEPSDVRFGEPALEAWWRHPFGTDGLGRDVLARTLWGARGSLLVGLGSALGILALGTLLGALAGWFKGAVDWSISRAVEVLESLPPLFLSLFVLAAIAAEGAGAAVAVTVVLVAAGWTHVARLVRAEILRLESREFVLAARALGFSSGRIVLRHVLPNAIQPALVAAVFAASWAMLAEAALAYLGLGVQEPLPSWGALVGSARAPEHWWLALFPGLFIFATVACALTIGDGLRETLDPRATRGAAAARVATVDGAPPP